MECGKVLTGIKTKSWMGNQHEMLQQHIRMTRKGLERISEEKVILAKGNC
ncbi:hypothetical protein [uncultured Bacteroides sp.]|nr:hypothetical protein [uncultured Bacteroides sp.]